MTREIKFRAWDGERLRKVNTIGWVDEGVDFVTTPRYSGPAEDFTLMQYTGLKDKNGVEIYEGDILMAGDGYLGVIEYHSTRAQFIGRNVGMTFSEVEYDTLYTNNGRFNSAKVIGNIYEKSEETK